MPLWVDYSVWLISETAGLLMLLVYWLLSPALRTATQHTLHNRVCCGNVLLEKWDEAPSAPPSTETQLNNLKNDVPKKGSTASRSLTSTPRHQANGRPPTLGAEQLHGGSLDLEAAGEKFWGEILERAVSSTSLHNVNRVNKAQKESNHYAVSSFVEIPREFRIKCDLHPMGIRPV